MTRSYHQKYVVKIIRHTYSKIAPAKHPYIGFTLAAFLFLLSCQKAPIRIMPGAEGVKNYVFMGHIYRSQEAVDERIEEMNFSEFDGVWLGGDLTIKSSSKPHHLLYLDDLFDLGNANTHWAWGNHDIWDGHEDWIRYFTGRELFYSQHRNGITLFLLNTNLTRDNDCITLDKQFQFFLDVCDTISASSHLILLSHHIAWNHVIPEFDTEDIANADKTFQFFSCSTDAKFHSVIYPTLKKVQQRGVQVMVLAGDLGQKKKSFEYTSGDGIVFLASGIDGVAYTNGDAGRKDPQDSILIFHHHPATGNLEWEFANLEHLLKAQQR